MGPLPNQSATPGLCQIPQLQHGLLARLPARKHAAATSWYLLELVAVAAAEIAGCGKFSPNHPTFPFSVLEGEPES